MKNKVLNIIIIVLVVGCLILGGKIGYDYYMGECEQYNDNIVNFTIEMIKGNKSLEDVDSLDATDEVKESLRQYYNDTFYSDDDLILVQENIDDLIKYIPEVKEYQKQFSKEDLMSDKYEMAVDNLFVKELSKYLNETLTEEDYTDEDRETSNKIYVYKIYRNYYEETKELVKENNNLYINVKDLTFNDGLYTCYYKGLKFDIIRDVLDNVMQSEIEKSEKYQSIECKSLFKEDGKTIYVLKDFLDNKYTFKGSMKFGKLVNIEF